MRDWRRGRPTIGVLAGWQVYGGTLHGFLGPVFDRIRTAARERECNLLLACGLSHVTRPDAAPTIAAAWPTISPESDFVPVGPWNTDGLIVITPLLSDARSRYVRQTIAEGHAVIFVGAGE